MKTYIFIHGGESFQTHEEYLKWIETTAVEWNLDPFAIKTEKKKWKTEIANMLTLNGDIVYLPNFPNPQNAKYSEWKLFFDTWITQIPLTSEIILIGNSLGGCFLLNYFSENPKPLPISNIHLIASCIEAGDFTPPINYDFLQKLGDTVHIWHSEDDMVVPFSIGMELSKIFPEAETHFFEIEKGYGHFHGVEKIEELENILSNK
ncbi:hypothetical protein HOO68_03335 [Candidatus Gracilibacteria bacterium]|nr:hypothetical protein [Candidatus Gracilibacteria bacterium]